MSRYTLKSIYNQLIDGEVVSKFLIVGIVGLGVETAVLTFLVELFGVFPTVSAAIGKEASILAMFLLNTVWTFSDHKPKTRKEFTAQLFKSHGVRIVGGGISLGVLHLLIISTSIWYVVANVIGIIVGFGFNYVFEHAFTWKTHDKE